MIGVVLAIVAAGLFAVAAVLQADAVRGGDGVRAAVRDRRWWAGAGCLCVAAGTHGCALIFAPLAVVQPIGVLAVLGTVWWRRGRSRGYGAVALLILGVGSFVGTATVSASSPLWTAALGAGAGVAGALAGWVVLGLVWPRIRCVAFACAGATGFALVSVCTRLIALCWSQGVGVVLALAAIGVAAALVGGFLVQQAYRWGGTDLVLACQTVVDPIVAVVLGAVFLGEHLDFGVWQVLGACCGVGAIVVLHRVHCGPSTVDGRQQKLGENRVRQLV